MAALHRLRLVGEKLVRIGVEHGRGAGIKRGIDGEDQHRANLEVFWFRLNAAQGMNFNGCVWLEKSRRDRIFRLHKLLKLL